MKINYDILNELKDINVKKYLGDKSIGLCSGIAKMNSYYPWTRVSAGFSIFKNDEISLTYLTIIEKYIINNFEYTPFSTNWGIDQTALYMGYLLMKETDYNFDFARLRLNMLTSDQNNRY